MTDAFVIKSVIRAVDKFSPTFMRMAANMKRFGDKTKGFGRAATTNLSLPVAAFGALTIKAAVDFDKAMNRVEAKSGEGGKTLQAMREQAMHLGKTTAFSATQAGEAMAFLAQAGWEANQIMAGTPALLDLAASSEIELGRAADIASNIMGQFKISAEDTARVADVLAATTASANVDMEMLAESFKDAGPIADKFGLSLEDTAAAIGLLGNVGIQGSKAGTAMKRMMLSLVDPAGDAGKLLDELGVKTKDLATGQMRPLAAIMGEFGEKLNTLGDAHQLKAIHTLFGKIPIAAATELIDQARTGAWQDYAEDLLHVEGRAKSMAEILMKGAPGALAKFNSAFEGLMLSIADSGLIDWFAEAMKGLTGFINSLSESNPTLLKWGSIAAIAAAALGPLLIGLGTLLATFSLISAPVLIGVAAIAAFAAAVYMIYDTWDDIGRWFSAKWTSIVRGFEEGFIGGIINLLKEINPVYLMFEYLDGFINYLFGVDISWWFTKQIMKIASSLPDWLLDFLEINTSAPSSGPVSRRPPATRADEPPSEAVRRVVQSAGPQKTVAEARLEIEVKSKEDTKITSITKGEGLDLVVGKGSQYSVL